MSNAWSQAFSQLEDEYGIPKGYLTGAFGIESNFGRAHDRAGSQFKGPFQLGNSVRSTYKVSDPSDLMQSARAAAAYARDNMKSLAHRGISNITGPMLYLAHQQGAGGAGNLLSHPDAPAGQFTNPEFIRANAGDPNAPAAAFVDKFSNMYGRKIAEAGGDNIPGPPMALAAQQPSGPQDPGGQAIQNAFGPPKANPEDATWERMGNIGNGLMGAGAALMAINNPSGASALMSGMRNSAKQSEWHSAGTTPDGTGLIQMNQKTGEARVVPLPGVKPRQAEDNRTTFQKDYDFIKNDPAAKEAWDTAHGVKPEQPMDAETKQMWAGYVLNDPAALRQVPAKQRAEVMTELTRQAKEAGITGKDMQATVIANRGKIADDVKRSQIIGTLDTFKGEFLAGAKQVMDYAKELSHATGAKSIDGLLQWAQEHAGTPEAAKIVAAKTAFEGLGRGYNRALSTASGGNVTGEQRAVQLLNPSMPFDQIEAGIKVMVGDIMRVNDYAKFSRDNQRALNAGQPVPHPEIEDEGKFFTQFAGKPQEGPQASPATPAGKPSSGLPEGAQKAPDGNYYVQQNGKWYRIVPK